MTEYQVGTSFLGVYHCTVLRKEPSGKENPIIRWEVEAQGETDQWVCSSISIIPLSALGQAAFFVVAGTGSETVHMRQISYRTPATLTVNLACTRQRTSLAH